MRLLEKGPDPKGCRELRCKGNGVGNTAGCGALLLVSPRDVKSFVSHDYGGGSDTNYYFVCPVCHAETYVSYSTFSSCR
ncbi:hypothetical protein A2304_03275 [Candidatus Uhrbacteria bacterium RIFOXYB2_FULL_57_15]|uniref:Uncharacterized protein n=1 Tax=Candidatus Uhrbacteria bacterium RIFOXYB2_FULL_57_15 TaxID=1802422 RepID=A0A1F7WAA8_9BACT|nr:MAG: hypothetical protein A2304_03275 [Candidatus Uhrbacteria bacterium RIFOXYB2_FULL_57_15]